jgi:hypothetical protein
MPKIALAKCPHCQNAVRIPREWLHQPMRCKFCRQIFQAKQRPAETGVARPAPPPAAVASPQVLRSVPFSPGKVPLPTAQRTTPRQSSSGLWAGAAVTAAVLLTASVLVVIFWDEINELGGRPAEQSREIAKVINPKKQFAEPPKNPDAAPTTAKAIITTRPAIRVAPAPIPRPKPVIPPAPPLPPPEQEVKPKPAPAPKEPPKTETVKNETPKNDSPKKVEVARPDPPIKPKAPPDPALFPRRALVISVSNYLLASPLAYGSPREKGFPGSSVRAVLQELSNPNLAFPSSQLFELSDGAAVDAVPPVKSVLETTITDYLSSARPQDRIVLLFAGHAMEIDKEAYLVPLDVPLKDADPKELLPLSWLYDRLRECKARQKLLIVDVCRLNPGRNDPRPGSGPMGEVLDAKLRQPPPGVQVWSSCIKEQQSYELERGSVFLQGLCAALQEPLSAMPDPKEGLPLDVLVSRVNKYLESALKMHKLVQGSRLSGSEPKTGAPFDPAVPLAAVLKIKPPANPVASVAGPELLRSIVEELRLAPPARSSGEGKEEITLESLPPFPARVLEPYRADYGSLDQLERIPGKYPLRVATLKAAQVLRDNIHKVRMKESFPGMNIAQLKQQALREQGDPGKSILALKEALEELKNAGEKRKKEKSQRWQANYDFVLARLESRLVYVYEYNYMLAQIRSDSLPPLENGATGYRLAARKKVSIQEPEVKELVKEIDRTWKRLEKDYAGTPWAVVASQDRLVELGLEWKATR